MKKLLKRLWILQEKEFITHSVLFHRQIKTTKVRLNPYNPISYILYILLGVFTIVFSLGYVLHVVFSTLKINITPFKYKQL